jgi:hypothetical protein
MEKRRIETEGRGTSPRLGRNFILEIRKGEGLKRRDCEGRENVFYPSL